MNAERNVYAKVTGDGKTKQTVYEEPVKPGDIVLVDAVTLRNLEKKGKLTPASKEEISKHQAAEAKAKEAAAKAKKETGTQEKGGE